MSYEVGNYDNGDLVVAVTSLLGPKIYKACLKNISSRSPRYFQRLTNSYHETAVECWKATHATLPHRLTALAPFIRIFLPREGFWRTHAKRGRFGQWWDDLFGSCYRSSDVIGHGWKAMAREMWGTPDGAARDGQCDLKGIAEGLGASSKCIWLSPTQELQVATDYCMFKAPVCMEEPSCGHVSYTKVEGDDKRSGGGQLGRSRRKKITGGVMSPECNACIRKDSGCATTKNRIRTGVGSFGVENEEWWRDQMCAACQ
jgi:hypothetical protein